MGPKPIGPGTSRAAPPAVRHRRGRDPLRRRRLRRRPRHRLVSSHASLIAGEEPTALQRLAAASDFGAGLSGTLPREEYLFINTDLTVYVEREPVGEWICLESQTRIARDGIGVAESVRFDERGRMGRATQALLWRPR
jgi:Thioesterase-like superfamily